MLYLVIALFALAFVASLFGLYSSRNGDEGTIVAPSSSCATCNGENDKCEQECMMEAATKEIEYFDDEELDVFKGRASEDYTDEEAEQFTYVLETMRQEEVADWCRSLTLRGINLPNQVKDEAFMLMKE